MVSDEQPNRTPRLSFPGGRIDVGETTLQAAQRQMREETGYSFRHWRLVQIVQPYTKMEWFIYTYLAWQSTGVVAPQLDAGEKVTPQRLDLHQLKRLVDGKVGYLGEAQALFDRVRTIDDLTKLPVFQGKTIER